MSHTDNSTIRHWHIQIRPKSSAHDGRARDVLADVRQIGLDWIEGVRSSRLYLLSGSMTEQQVRLISDELLLDPVAETCEVGPGLAGRQTGSSAIEVHTLPGVTNPVAMSTLEAARRLLEFHKLQGTHIVELQTARRYEIIGARELADLERIAAGVLANGAG